MDWIRGIGEGPAHRRAAYTPGTLLLPARDDLDAIAEVLADGRIRLDEELYDTPSGAARAAVGMATNGWTFWIADTAEGPRKLAELRATLAEA